jgi:hypothetical protein
MVVNILARSNQNYPSVALMSQGSSEVTEIRISDSIPKPPFLIPLKERFLNAFYSIL